MGSVIGDPDIILCDESQKHIFLIELKIQAKKTNGKFSLQQYTKYSNLIQLLESNGKLAKAALLAPSDEINKSIVNNEVNWFDYKAAFIAKRARLVEIGAVAGTHEAAVAHHRRQFLAQRFGQLCPQGVADAA